MQVKLYKIETGIKVPPVAVSRKPSSPSAVALTLQKLDRGDSFLIRDELAALKAIKIVRDFNTREHARKNGKQFVTRKVGLGARVWRVR